MNEPRFSVLMHDMLCFAQAGENWDWGTFFWRLSQAMIYLVIGLAVFAATYLIIDKVTPFSLRKELLEDKNYALAIVLGSVFISIAIILAASIHG